MKTNLDEIKSDVCATFNKNFDMWVTPRELHVTIDSVSGIGTFTYFRGDTVCIAVVATRNPRGTIKYTKVNY